MSDLAFFVLAAALLAGALGTVLARSLYRAAYCLAGTLLATAGFYLLLSAPVVFALVLTGTPESGPPWRRPIPAAIVSFMVFGVLAPFAGSVSPSPVAGGPDPSGTAGAVLFTRYVVPFELLSLLLLGALFGALVLARRDGRVR